MANPLELPQIAGTQANKHVTSNDIDLLISDAIAGNANVTISTTSPVVIDKETYLENGQIRLVPDGTTPPTAAFTVQFEGRAAGQNRGLIRVENATLQDVTSLEVSGQGAAPSLPAGSFILIWLNSNSVKAATSAELSLTFASDADIRSAATGNRVLKSDRIETSAAFVTLTDAANIAVDWDTFINGEVTLGGNRTLSNPSNGQPGTWRTIIVKQDATGSRTMAFGTHYKSPGGLPVLTTAASAIDTLAILCVSSTEYFVFANKDIKV